MVPAISCKFKPLLFGITLKSSPEHCKFVISLIQLTKVLDKGVFCSPLFMLYGVVDPVRLFGGLRRVAVLRLYTRQGRIVEGELQRVALACTRDHEER